MKFDRLFQILSYRRCHTSKGEEEMIQKILMPYNPGIDRCGNLHISVGTGSRTLFSCHTDTVHRSNDFRFHSKFGKVPIKKPKKEPEQVKQKITVLCDPEAGKFIALDEDKGECLGADDGTGIFILLYLIDNKVPGHYIFHRGEEKGGIGSSWLAENKPGFLRYFDRAVAFDRKGISDVIRTQAGVCCSNEFAVELSEELNDTNEIFDFAPDHGVFTDTANYTHLIPECTNLSVGYFSQHSDKETQSIDFLELFMPALLKVKWDQLITIRDPKEVTPWESYYGDYDFKNSVLYDSTPLEDQKFGTYETHQKCYDVYDLVMEYPAEISEILEAFGFDFDFLQQQINQEKKHYG